MRKNSTTADLNGKSDLVLPPLRGGRGRARGAGRAKPSFNEYNESTAGIEASATPLGRKAT